MVKRQHALVDAYDATRLLCQQQCGDGSVSAETTRATLDRAKSLGNEIDALDVEIAKLKGAGGGGLGLNVVMLLVGVGIVLVAFAL
jgi:hypothetical protein